MDHHPVNRWIILLTGLGLVLLAFLASGQALAQDRGPAAPLAPLGSGFTYQGQLKDSAGTPISDSCDFRFILYDAESGGAQVGPLVEMPAVAVAGGYFTVALDFGSTAFTGAGRWLELGVRCPTGSGDYTPLNPRQALTAAPYASYALDADRLDGQQGTYYLNASNLNAGTLGTGYYAAYSDLTAEGYLDLSAVGDLLTRSQGDARYSAAVHNHWGQAWTGAGTGLTLSGGTTGLSGSGSSYGVYGVSASTSGYGVYGSATATSGVNYGVYGRSYSTEGYGVFGIGKYGVYGTSSLIGGRGVMGSATATSGTVFGVYGTSPSTSGYGVFGNATATSGATFGVHGVSASTSGYGVFGIAGGSSGITAGTYGETVSPDGFGVAGYSHYTGVGVGAWSNSGNLIEAYAGNYPGGTLRFYVSTAGGVYADSGFFTYKTSQLDGATHALASIQSPEVWLEDFGQARLVNGMAVVTIAPDFAGMANLAANYLVFVTLEGDCPGVYITNKTPTSFEVHEVNGGKSNVAFSYSLVAKQAGSETVRLPVVTLPATVEVARPPAGGEQPVEQPQPAAPVLSEEPVQP